MDLAQSSNLSPIYRRGSIDDIKLIYRFLNDLAAYEGFPETWITEARWQEIFSNSQNVKALICEVDKSPVGLAMWSEKFSAYSGGLNMWLLELYVTEPFRKKGLGKMMFLELKKIAAEYQYKKIEWFVMSDNEHAKTFYRSLGAIRTENTERWNIELTTKSPTGKE